LKKNDTLENLTDNELVIRICEENNTILFDYLYDRYESKVYNKCYGFVKSRDEAEDLTQDIFLKVFGKLHTFKRQSSFSTWLYALTHVQCTNYVTREEENKISKATESVENDKQHLQLEVGDDSLFQMKAIKLQKAKDNIDPEDKSMLLLKYQDEVSIRELEVLLNISESAVKVSLKRAKSRIIEAYNNLY
jgi:RNA polymerase sigma factor (sigma-70 family)